MRPFRTAASRQTPVAVPRRPARPEGTQARWYGPLSVGVDLAGAALPVAAAIAEVREPRPVHLVSAAALAWPLIRAAARRYTSAAWGDGGGLGAVLKDWLLLVGALATLRVLCGLDNVPADTFTVLIPALVLTAACHTVIHRHLLAARRDGRALRHVVLVGESPSIDAVVEQLAQRTDHEYVVVACCPVGEDAVLSGVPVYVRLPRAEPDGAEPDAAPVLRAVDAVGADLVFVVPGPHLSGRRLRRLSWAVHDRGCPIVVLPGIVEVARRRMRLTSASGLTLLHIAPPISRGAPAVLKAAVDRVGALVLIVLLAPLLLALALAVRLTSPGPAFYRQIRVGRDNTPFPMWKFRTMVVDADRMKEQLAAANEHDGHMFKMRRDPRVTPLGRFLRRYSLDELPQLFNVLLGHMSLVGPRPPVPEEVVQYDPVEMRRLRVKPGLTGLWQVSGRSDLSWHETVSLDLRYVDNWSPALDVHVMARTVRAVLSGQGAY
ncbi:sugar transferase [Streptomyces thermoviolaceus]|uniref:sugar transferase n=1 Tax=Streptomyces thermoviolaceus TaxID=1952 RepID=UPI001998E742|nr:sugar transferase [Streptomyces thermoviolaceus]WTD50326.1 sugar transferase [Streptomyces thermoviolaceus]GGV63777.1 exopolysaccharide biosynthesis polyprenyl glycosylphosphotransferase [Streptomyces thermoviolaceus subsp. apingens]GHA89988.1 exopolysaccharide biosynthesis polyprenyl glycosylphosphotransferase [Streptomyces thermoviolaceus subsp. thermoviolaceus]